MCVIVERNNYVKESQMKIQLDEAMEVLADDPQLNQLVKVTSNQLGITQETFMALALQYLEHHMISFN